MSEITEQCCEVPLEERLRGIPQDARITWTDPDGLKATHFVPIGLLAHRAADALRSHAELVRDAWQPIETAPDNTDVLVWLLGWGCGGEARHWGDDGWYVAGNAPSDSWGAQIYPTHWRPLPAPPALPKDSP